MAKLLRSTCFALMGLPLTGCGSDSEPGTGRASAASCAFGYSDEELAERSWAFDGTIQSLGTVTDSRLGEVDAATFSVNRWYKGGGGLVVTVQFAFPAGESEDIRAEVGTRLLVAGEPRWGGAPLDDAVAWGCGFTRAWNESDSERWMSVFGHG